MMEFEIFGSKKSDQKFIISFLTLINKKFWSINIYVVMPRTYLESLKMIAQKIEEEMDFEVVMLGKLRVQDNYTQVLTFG